MNKMSSSWGPPLWMLLHSVAERIGFLNTILLATDESNEIFFLLSSVDKIMPCSLCRLHYKEWRKTKPITALSKLRGSELRYAVRKWLYDLHEDVNTRKKRNSSGIMMEMLPELYKKMPLEFLFQEFAKQLLFFPNQVSHYDLQDFHRHVRMLDNLTAAAAAAAAK